MQNKERFIKELKDQLKGMNPKIKEEIIYDYEEHFKEGLAKGLSEEEIIEKLGTAQRIAAQYRFEEAIEKAEAKLTPQGVFRAILAGLSLSLFNMIFVLGLYVGLLATLFALFASTIAGVLAGLVTIVQAFWPSEFSWFHISELLSFFDLTFGELASRALLFGTGLGLVILSSLLAVGVGFIIKWFFQGTLNYIKANVNIVQNVSRIK